VKYTCPFCGTVYLYGLFEDDSDYQEHRRKCELHNGDIAWRTST